MGNLVFLDPRRYGLFPGQNPYLPDVDATTPPFLPADAASGAMMSPPKAAPAQPAAQQGRPTKMQMFGQMIRSGIDAASTPNIAGGGGADVMRGLANANDQQMARDAASQNLELQRRAADRQDAAMAAQDAENRAQAQWYRQRAEAAMQPKPAPPVRAVQDKVTGDWVDPTTRQVVQAASPKPAAPTVPVGIGQTGVVGDYGPPQSVQVSDPVAGGMKTLEFPAWGRQVEMAPRDAAAVMNAGASQARAEAPKPLRAEVTRNFAKGGQVGDLHRFYDPETAKLVKEEFVPRVATPARSAAAGAAPRTSRVAEIDGFINRLMGDAAQRGVSPEYAIQAAENPQNYTDVPPAVKFEAVARLKRQAAAGRRPGKTPGTAALIPGAPAPATTGPVATQKTATSAEVAQYAQQRGVTAAAAEQALRQAGYVIR